MSCTAMRSFFSCLCLRSMQLFSAPRADAVSVKGGRTPATALRASNLGSPSVFIAERQKICQRCSPSASAEAITLHALRSACPSSRWPLGPCSVSGRAS